MSIQDRIKRYRSAGGAADLVRVEVLVPASGREEILSYAAAMRRSHRHRRDLIQQSIDEVVIRYGVRVLDNIDLSRLGNVEEKARVLAKALMARGDAKAFIAGRKLLEQCAA
ncbi:hypothetical protein JP75_20675 [Devosia riboflavina]|uniref:Uncharacterized protein n=1 Tax=Devosia riboflavina TaxID=46914 RepID=A0A087LXY5_9HYPH|nr:hypothetical protein [Devosia riboflavina]KFL29488.1 hypothetical protein JP75_20675 [Devosia riboflavina]